MSDALPITPDEIARQSIEAAEAGAAIIHLHARNPQTGAPTPDPNVFMQFLPRIKQSTKAIVNISTGGALGMSMDDRIAQYGIDELRYLQLGEALRQMEIRLGEAVSGADGRCHLPQHVQDDRLRHHAVGR